MSKTSRRKLGSTPKVRQRRRATLSSQKGSYARSSSKGGARADIRVQLNGRGVRSKRTNGDAGRLETHNGDAGHLAAVKNFDAATRLFARQNFAKARELFEKLVETAPPSVADRARVHLRLCLQRLNHRTAEPKTANDYHILGVSAINAGQLEAAIGYLSKAHRIEPEREEIRYALAAAHALQGDAEVALEHLKAAIALRPQSRFQARYDEDFQSLAADPRFQTLVQSTSITPRWS